MTRVSRPKQRFVIIRASRLAGLSILLVIAGCSTAPSSGDDAAEESAAERGEAAWKAGNYDEAMKLLQQAAIEGNARAQYAVGYMHYEGQGVEANVSEALTWIRRAANQGDERAIRALGLIADGLSYEDRGGRATGSSPSRADESSGP